MAEKSGEEGRREVKEEKEKFSFVGVSDKSLTPGFDAIFILDGGNPIPVAVIVIEDDKVIIKPCDRNGNPVKDSSKYQSTLSLTTILSRESD